MHVQLLGLQLRSVSESETCRACDGHFPGGSRQWALCWDGELWRMYEYLPGMPFGPYHGGPCIGPVLNTWNARRSTMDEEQMIKGRALTPEQKDLFLQAIREAWDAQPQLRFGQLIANWVYATLSNPDHGHVIRNEEALDRLFRIEDGDLAHNMVLWYTQRRPSPPVT